MNIMHIVNYIFVKIIYISSAKVIHRSVNNNIHDKSRQIQQYLITECNSIQWFGIDCLLMIRIFWYTSNEKHKIHKTMKYNKIFKRFDLKIMILRRDSIT